MLTQTVLSGTKDAASQSIQWAEAHADLGYQSCKTRNSAASSCMHMLTPNISCRGLLIEDLLAVLHALKPSEMPSAWYDPLAMRGHSACLRQPAALIGLQHCSCFTRAPQ